MVRNTFYVAVREDGQYYEIEGVSDYLLATSDLNYATRFKTIDEIKEMVGDEFANGKVFNPVSIETIESTLELKFKRYI